MKVKCINGSLTNNELTTGKEYEVLSEIGCYYQLKTNDKGIRYKCYVKSRFEVIKEDKEMIEKTFREVIADIKEGEVWESHCKKIIGFKDGDFEIRDNDGHKFGNAVSIRSANKYRLKRKECNFEEAFKAFEVGKEIESLASEIKYRRFDEKVSLFVVGKNEDFSGINNDNAIFSINEIRGKWYIND